MSLPPVEIPSGAMRFNSDSQKLEYYDGAQWLQVSTFSPNLNGGARGLFAGGFTSDPSGYYNIIEYITISSTGNSIDFGDLTLARWSQASASSSTRGVFAGGGNPGGKNIIDYVTISSTGDAIDFGDLSSSYGNKRVQTGCSNPTRGVFGGGYSNTNIIEYITISSTGNSVDFGDLTAARHGSAACSSSTRGLFGGGDGPSTNNIIDYITISTLGNALDFGDLSTTNQYRNNACSNVIRGLWGCGGPGSQINFVNISSLGNSVSFGSLSQTRDHACSTSSSIRGLWGGGFVSPSHVNTIDYVTIMTQSNAVDFGDLTGTARREFAACSNAHGGL